MGFFNPCAPPLPHLSNWRGPGDDPRFFSHRFLRRSEQRIEGASPGRFVPPAGARVVETEVQRFTVRPDGSVAGCVLERAHEGWRWQGKCEKSDYASLPGSARVRVERSNTLWDLEPATP